MKKGSIYLLGITLFVLAIFFAGCQPANFGTEDWYHFIPRDTARVWIERYDLKYRSADGRRDSNNLRQFAYADDFKRGKWMMGTMMAKNNVTGFRIYYGRKFTDSLVPILVGIDSIGNDVYWDKPITPSTATTQINPGYQQGAMDMSQKSPPAPIQSLQRIILLPDWIKLNQPMPSNTQSAQ